MSLYTVFTFKTTEDETKFLASIRNNRLSANKSPYLIWVRDPLTLQITMMDGDVCLDRYQLAWEYRAGYLPKLLKTMCQKKPNLTQQQIEDTVHLGRTDMQENISQVTGSYYPFEYISKINDVSSYNTWADKYPGFILQDHIAQLNRIEHAHQKATNILNQKLTMLEQDLIETRIKLDQITTAMNARLEQHEQTHDQKVREVVDNIDMLKLDMRKMNEAMMDIIRPDSEDFQALASSSTASKDWADKPTWSQDDSRHISNK